MTLQRTQNILPSSTVSKRKHVRNARHALLMLVCPRPDSICTTWYIITVLTSDLNQAMYENIHFYVCNTSCVSFFFVVGETGNTHTHGVARRRTNTLSVENRRRIDVH